MTARIVLVVSPFPNDSEGFIVDKFVGLLERGYDVHVLTGRGQAVGHHPELDELGPAVRGRVHDLSRHDLPARLLGAATRPVISARIVAHELRRGVPRDARLLHGLRLASLRPDLVHFEFGWHAAQLARAARLIGCPTVASFRGADANFVGIDDPGHYDEVWRSVHAVHCLGTDLWTRVVDRGCPADRRHVLIPPAVDTAVFAPTDRPTHDGPLRVVSVGRLHWKKGHEWALEGIAGALARGVDLRYRIIGEGPHRRAVEATIADLGLGEVVELEGVASRADVRDAMQHSDVCLHAAVSEGFCNSVLEAQAMELPVIATDADGLRENVEHGVTGLIVPRRDPGAITDRLVELAADPGRRRRLGRAGRERVERRFRPADQIDAFVALYEELLGA